MTLIPSSNTKNIVRFTQSEVNQSKLLKYTPATSGPFLSLDHLSQDLKSEIVPLINYGLKISAISLHLQVNSKVISKYLKEEQFHWVIEHRAYLNNDMFTTYKQSKIKESQRSLKKPSNSKIKNISLKLSPLSSNLVEIQKYSSGQTSEESINHLIESTCSPEAKTFAEKFIVTIKSREIDK
jgi:hypothetical protein